MSHQQRSMPFLFFSHFLLSMLYVKHQLLSCQKFWTFCHITAYICSVCSLYHIGFEFSPFLFTDILGTNRERVWVFQKKGCGRKSNSVMIHANSLPLPAGGKCKPLIARRCFAESVGTTASPPSRGRKTTRHITGKVTRHIVPPTPASPEYGTYTRPRMASCHGALGEMWNSPCVFEDNSEF